MRRSHHARNPQLNDIEARLLHEADKYQDWEADDQPIEDMAVHSEGRVDDFQPFRGDDAGLLGRLLGRGRR